MEKGATTVWGHLWGKTAQCRHLIGGKKVGGEVFVDVVIFGAKFAILLARH